MLSKRNDLTVLTRHSYAIIVKTKRSKCFLFSINGNYENNYSKESDKMTVFKKKILQNFNSEN